MVGAGVAQAVATAVRPSELPIFAAKHEVLVRPDAADDVERFEEHLPRLLLVDAEGLELGRAQATAEAHVEASASEVVEHRGLLCHEQRMPKGQDVDHAAEPDMAGRPRSGRDQQNGGRPGGGGVEMMVEKTKLIDADAVGQPDLPPMGPAQLPLP